MCVNLFIRNPTDHCVYTKETENQKVTIVIRVDNLVIVAGDKNVMKGVKKMLAAKFNMKDLGELKHFPGTDFEQNDQCENVTEEVH